MENMLGILAASLTTFSFLPQTTKTIKEKDTSSISLTMYIMHVIGILLWLIYGLSLKNIVLIMSSAITLLLSSIILINKVASHVINDDNRL
jgi:MtN3 and saliva related transmembrane protein